MHLLGTQLLHLALMLANGSGSPEGEAAGWTRFRGPNGSGISTATTIPVHWTDDDYNWKVELPGRGHSHPVFWGKKLFLTSSVDDGNVRVVLCLDADTGKTIWTREFKSQTHKKHRLNSFASSTPAVDADAVYCAFSVPDSYQLIALDHQGKDKWVVDLGTYESSHSSGTSPIVYEDMVVIGNEQLGESSLIALDRETGKIRWQTPRRIAKTAYSTPCVYHPPGGKPQLIFNSQAHGVSGVDAQTGRPLWEAPLFDKRSCSSPVITAGGLITGSCGSGGGGNYVVAVKPEGRGDISDKMAFKVDRSAPYVPTPVTNGDLLFLWSDGGIVTCVECPSGQLVWRKRVGDTYYGSPIRVRDRLYSMSINGECVVLAADRQFRELARIPLGEGSHSTPAVAHGRMYLRTFSHLMSVGGE